MQFDGSTNYVTISDDDSLSASGANLTVSAWIKFNDLPADNYSIVTKWKSPGDFEYYFAVNSDGTLFWETGKSNGGWQAGISSATVLSPGSWYHVVGVYDGIAMKMYINGGADAHTLAQTNVLHNGISPVAIGRNSDSGCGAQACFAYFNGTIDDVRIYNRALSAAEVAALYAYTGP